MAADTLPSLPAPLSVSVPLLTLIGAVIAAELSTPIVRLPLPILVIGVTLALMAVVLILIFPAPAKVRAKAPLIPPVRFRVELPAAPMVTALARVIAPL